MLRSVATMLLLVLLQIFRVAAVAGAAAHPHMPDDWQPPPPPPPIGDFMPTDHVVSQPPPPPPPIGDFMPNDHVASQPPPGKKQVKFRNQNDPNARRDGGQMVAEQIVIAGRNSYASDTAADADTGAAPSDPFMPGADDFEAPPPPPPLLEHEFMGGEVRSPESKPARVRFSSDSSTAPIVPSSHRVNPPPPCSVNAPLGRSGLQAYALPPGGAEGDERRRPDHYHSGVVPRRAAAGRYV